MYSLNDTLAREFPHSEIPGSKLICSSPRLIAACHVLHRLLMPRHSPCALLRLNFLYSLFSRIAWVSLNKIFCRIEKVFSFSCRFSTFRWNCIASFDAFTLFGKTQLISQFCPLLSVRFLTHLNPNIWIFRLPIRLSSFICLPQFN